MTDSTQPYAVILPVRNEAECLGEVLEELLAELPRERFRIAVGLNACTDESESIARSHPVVVGTTDTAGYGHGCMAAIEALCRVACPPRAYLFAAGDGANDPRDILRLVETHEDRSADFVIGQRTLRWDNWHPMGVQRALPNLTLGLFTSLLTGRLWSDLGPLRLIASPLFQRMQMQELTWGWTIESQILACRLGAQIEALPVDERCRLAGEQKVSGVHWRQSLRIALAIAAAGWRVRHRELDPVSVSEPASQPS